MPVTKKTTAVVPAGKKKGGAMFPRIPLKDAVDFAIRLAAKTHIGPQPASVILKGVFNNKGSPGEVRASALKQFNLLAGKKDAYTATDLARQIAAAPESERSPLLAEACLTPKVFKALFDMYHGDTVGVAKLRQAAAQQNVHLDEAEKCARLFAESAAFAQLGTISGDTLQLVAAATLPRAGTFEELADDQDDAEEQSDIEKPEDKLLDPPKATVQVEAGGSQASARSVIQVNIAVDSSMDTDKLEKQLAILRRYGAL